MVYDELHRLALLLKSVVRTSGLRVGELERNLGLGKGTLNRIFIGKIDLKMRHILLVLGAVGITPGQFFRLAYPGEGEASAPGDPNLATQLLELLQAQGLASARPEPPARTTSPQDLDRHIEAVLRRMGISPPRPDTRAKRGTAAARPRAGKQQAGAQEPPAAAGRPRRARKNG